MIRDEPAEIDRLAVQARAWSGEADALLDRIGVMPGWRCVDLGCGPRGILDLLSRRVGRRGEVVGVDRAPFRLMAAATTAEEAGWANVRLLHADVRQTGLPRGHYDLVHARLVCQESGLTGLLREMIALARPGGVIAVEEPGFAPWSIDPVPRGFRELVPEVTKLFLRRTRSAGPSVAAAFRRAGLVDVETRDAQLTLRGGDRYAATPLHALRAATQALLAAGAVTRGRLRGLAARLNHAANDAGVLHRSFKTVQVWGRRRTRTR